jgi:hypothetical protein
MDEDLRARGDDGPPAPHDEAGTNIARHMALMRQKQELRHERDQLLLDLAKGLGQARMGEALGVPTRDAARLLANARTRLLATSTGLFAESDDEIVVRRLRARQTAGPAGAGKATAPERGRAPEQPEDQSPASPRILGPRGSRERRSGRWLDADTHYELLGLQSPGDR